jgi:SAM-dependent methyltransferase
MREDQVTADAFATSWNNLPPGSVYTSAQFDDWMAPLQAADFHGRAVLELGCGNGSLLVHATRWSPRELVGVDLGSSVATARANLQTTGFAAAEVVQEDLVEFQSDGFDVVYCIGVLHHLRDPQAGFAAVVRNVKPGGRFHCWVYGKEGNRLVILLVEPIRKIACRLPWWFTKYFIATPLALPFYLYAKTLRLASRAAGLKRWLARLPLYEYCLWISVREYAFFRHVAFDQIVTPQTAYISKPQIEEWLRAIPDVARDSVYVIQRNGNSWKFGARKAA